MAIVDVESSGEDRRAGKKVRRQCGEKEGGFRRFERAERRWGYETLMLLGCFPSPLTQ